MIILPYLQKIDFLATKYGIKPLMRTNCNDSESFKLVRGFCAKNGMFAVRSKERVASFASGNSKAYYVYISKKKAIAERFSLEDPELYLNPDINKIRTFAEFLGYPDCCIDAFLNVSKSNYSEGYKKRLIFKKIIAEEKNYLNNNLLYGMGLSLSFFYPCSYKCKNAAAYNTKVMKMLCSKDSKFAATVKKYLRLPLLIWFDITPGNTAESFFHNRIQLVLDVRSSRSGIHYRKAEIGRNYVNCNKSYPERLLSYFLLGNRCSIRPDSIAINCDDTKLAILPVDSRYHGVLVEF